MTEVEIIEGASDAAIAGWLRDRLERALEASDTPVAITVPGGSTPFPILGALAQAPLDWPRVTVWAGDDRLVPEDHPASNTGKIRALLEPAGAALRARLARDGRRRAHRLAVPQHRPACRRPAAGAAADPQSASARGAVRSRDADHS